MESVKSDKNYKYEAYGLKIHSEIPLPELIQLKSENPDLTICLGDVDLNLDDLIHEGESYKVTPNAIYRYWDFVGKFKITKNSIIIEPNPKLEKMVFRNFLLGTVFATFLRLRGLFVLHASSVNINGYAVAFAGFKGLGKSTTALNFYKKGYPIISDDYIAIELDHSDIPVVSSGFPKLRISNNTREAMGFKKLNIKHNSIIDKTYMDAPNLFLVNKFPLIKIYILQRNNQFNIVPLNNQEKFIELVRNTFGIEMFSKSELPNNFFQCAKLAKILNLSILKLPNSIQSLQDVLKIIECDSGAFK